MAELITKIDLLRIKRQHIGPILLGMFLEKGSLRLRLTVAEMQHLATKDYDGMTHLDHLFREAAHNAGLKHEYEDWNFSNTGDVREKYVWDPDRVKHGE